MGVRVLLADHFSGCSGKPTSIIPQLSALPQKIMRKREKETVRQDDTNEIGG